MLWQVVAGAVLSLVLLAVVITLVLKRAPLLFVADKLPGNLYGGADDVGDLVGAPDDGAGSPGDGPGAGGTDEGARSRDDGST